ncbi:MAG: hypothetical protein ABR985_04875 [Methanotrichaceae archaeon]|jgi:hypothetical protein
MKSIMLAALVLGFVLGTAAIATAYDYSQNAVDSFVGSHYPFTYPNQVVDKNVSFSFEQNVQGNGYYMTYKYAKMGSTEFKDYAHGSGSLDNEAVLSSYNSSHQYHLWNADWNDANQNCIQYKETTHAVYAPTRIAVGTGYYAVNPLNYDSLIKEETTVKNRLAGSSMENQVEYAHKLDKDLSLMVKDWTNFTYDPTFTSNSVTQMKITEDVGEGKIHIGVLQANADGSGRIPTSLVSMKTTAWKNPAIDIDEDYWGTYHVEKNMTLSVPYSRIKPTYDWLPCTCNEGWNDMTIHDQRYHSAKGFFDCTSCPFPYCNNP